MVPHQTPDQHCTVNSQTLRLVDALFLLFQSNKMEMSEGGAKPPVSVSHIRQACHMSKHANHAMHAMCMPDRQHAEVTISHELQSENV